MNRRKGILLLAFVLLLAGGGVWGWRAWEQRQAWAADLPARPESVSPALQARLDACEARLKRWPPDVAALEELARLYLANGYSDEAETALRGVVKRQPENAHAAHYLAGLAAGFGQLEEAIPLWQSVSRLAPDFAPARIKLADALFKTNRTAEAGQVYTEVLAKEPRNTYALVGLARVDIASGRWGSARRRLEQAIEADSLFSAAHTQLAMVAERLGDAATAEIERERGKELGRFKDVPDPWVDELIADCYDPYRLQVLAATLTATNGGRAALAPLQRALALDARDPRTLRQIGRVYLDLHEYREAGEHLAKAVELDPTNPTAYIDLVGVYRAENNRAAAIRLLTKGVESCPDAAGLHYELGLAYVAEQQLEEAIPHFREARRLAPDNLAAYEDLARVCFKLGREEEGRETVEAALRQDSGAAPILMLMTRHLIETGDAPGAEGFLVRTREAGVLPRLLDELVRAFTRRFGRAPRA